MLSINQIAALITEDVNAPPRMISETDWSKVREALLDKFNAFALDDVPPEKVRDELVRIDPYFDEGNLTELGISPERFDEYHKLNDEDELEGFESDEALKRKEERQNQSGSEGEFEGFEPGELDELDDNTGDPTDPYDSLGKGEAWSKAPFIELQDLAKQTGKSVEEINQARKNNELRGFRDGATWQFKLPDAEQWHQDNTGLFDNTEPLQQTQKWGDGASVYKNDPEQGYPDDLELRDGWDDEPDDEYDEPINEPYDSDTDGGKPIGEPIEEPIGGVSPPSEDPEFDEEPDDGIAYTDGAPDAPVNREDPDDYDLRLAGSDHEDAHEDAYEHPDDLDDEQEYDDVDWVDDEEVTPDDIPTDPADPEAERAAATKANRQAGAGRARQAKADKRQGMEQTADIDIDAVLGILKQSGVKATRTKLIDQVNQHGRDKLFKFLSKKGVFRHVIANQADNQQYMGDVLTQMVNNPAMKAWLVDALGRKSINLGKMAEKTIPDQTSRAKLVQSALGGAERGTYGLGDQMEQDRVSGMGDDFASSSRRRNG